MKNRRVIITGIGLLLLPPLLLIPLCLFVVELVMVKSFGVAWGNAWATLSEMHFFEYIGLCSAVTGVLVLICFPFAYYKLAGKFKEQKEQEDFNRKKQMLHDILYSGMTEAMTSQQDGKWEPYNFVQVTDNHIYMISHVDSLFSDNQSLFLRQVLELLKEISQQADQGEVPEAKQSVEKLVKLVATSSYPTHESPMQSGRDRDEWFNEKILIILQLLSEKTNKQGMDAAG